MKKLNPNLNPKNVLAVNFCVSEAYIAVSVSLVDGVARNPRFYSGDGFRKVKKKNVIMDKQMTDDVFRGITRSIVDEALADDACIILGNLEAIEQRERRPYFKLLAYISNKATWEGLPVYQVKEAWTSTTCHKCGEVGERLLQGLFRCPSCNLVYNSDLNAALNIAKGYLSCTQKDAEGYRR